MGQQSVTMLGRRDVLPGLQPATAAVWSGGVVRQILACTDFSPVSVLAVEEAARLSLERNARLTLLHVFEYGVASARDEGAAGVAEKLRNNECHRLTELLKRLRTTGVQVNAVMTDGDAGDAILKAIVEHQADVAVLGTHGFSGVERMIFGSVAEQVFRRASCPVLTVGPRTDQGLSAAVGGPVVFATDFQRPMMEAVRYAASYAQASSAALHCLHVLPLPMEHSERAAAVPQIMTEALHHLLDADAERQTRPVCSIAYGSEISQTIVDYAEEHGARLIVLGVRRRLPISHHLPARVTYQTIVTASCPVLTISYTPD
ncbi:MAG: universal stress protein [Acidobacteriota bacterium]|nr:universal stress protein [Acidobacteriota bacterium]